MNSFLFLFTTIFTITTQQVTQVHSKPKPKLNNGPPINVTKQFSFPNFNQTTTKDNIKLLGSAKISTTNKSLQIPDQTQLSDLKHQAGRALYASPLRVFDPQTDTPASFYTTFSFQFRNISTKTTQNQQLLSANGGDGGGSGLTFIMVPDEFTIGRPGPWLAMINDACDDDYKAFAVEFDTRFNPEFGDPNDNHVGIDLGNMVSVKTINASDAGVSLNDGSIHRAWINYDGPNRVIDIRLGSDGSDLPSKPIFSSSLDISPFLNEYMFIGFSASTGNTSQIHSILSWNFTSTTQAFLRIPSEKTCEAKIVVDRAGKIRKTEAPKSFLIFISIVASILAILLFFYLNSRRKTEKSPPTKHKPSPPNKPRKFTFTELSAATASFASPELVPGGDERGVFYQGKIGSCHVAIKRFSPEFLSSVGEDRRRLRKEVKEIAKLRHPNLVGIRGWFIESNKEAMIVYEIMGNGRLDKWVFGIGVLAWTRRFKVIKDVSEGVSYLHNRDLAHKNLKTTSVFLDLSFRALAGDFGFVLCSGESRRFEAAVSRSNDVFEFGVLALEIVSGRRRNEENFALLESAWALHESGEIEKIVDKRMGSVVNVEQAVRVLEIALLCTLNENKGRLDMSEVVELLNSERPVPELPPNRPVSLFPYSSMNVGLCTGYSCSFRT